MAEVTTQAVIETRHEAAVAQVQAVIVTIIGIEIIIVVRIGIEIIVATEITARLLSLLRDEMLIKAEATIETFCSHFFLFSRRKTSQKYPSPLYLSFAKKKTLLQNMFNFLHKYKGLLMSFSHFFHDFVLSLNLVALQKTFFPFATPKTLLDDDD